MTDTCNGKDKLTGQQARETARRMRHTRAYRCPDCGKWHVGVPQHQKNRRHR